MKTNLKYKTLFSSLLAFVISTNVFSQYNPDTTASPKKNFSFAVRGKVIGFFIIEDTFFATATLGGELIYNHRHSIGMDATWFRWKFQTDDDHDNPMYNQLLPRSYFLFDYKFRFAKVDFGCFYLNAYEKTGRYKERYEPFHYDFGTMDTTFLRSTLNGTFNEVGFGVGLKLMDYTESGLGLDISTNVARRFSVNDIRDYGASTNYFADDVKVNKYVFYMRLNVFYLF